MLGGNPAVVKELRVSPAGKSVVLSKFVLYVIGGAARTTGVLARKTRMAIRKGVIMDDCFVCRFGCRVFAFQKPLSVIG